MNFTKEMITKAQLAKSVEELMALAQGEGIELSEQNAQTYFNFLNSNGELSESELDFVAGGKGEPSGPPAPKFRVGQQFRIFYATTGTIAHGVITGIDFTCYSPQSGYKYFVQYEGGGQDYWYLETLHNASVYD